MFLWGNPNEINNGQHTWNNYRKLPNIDILNKILLYPINFYIIFYILAIFSLYFTRFDIYFAMFGIFSWSLRNIIILVDYNIIHL